MVSSVIGAVVGGATSMLGAKKQASAARHAAALQHQQYQQARADMAPWRETGANALAELAALYGLSGDAPQSDAFGRFRATPDYRFRLAQGLEALDRSAAARGLLLSGRQLKAANEYGQALAAGEYADYLNRLAAMAGIGQTAAAQSATIGSDAAMHAGNAAMQSAQAWSRGVNGIGNALATLFEAYRRSARAAKADNRSNPNRSPTGELIGHYYTDIT